MKNKIACLLVLMVFTISILHGVGAEQRKIYRSIEDKIQSEGSADVIVRVSGGTVEGRKASTQAITAAASTVASTLKNKKELKIIDAYSGTLSRKGLRELNSLKAQGYDVEIYEDVVFHLDASKSKGDIETQLDNSVPSIGANYSQNVLNITGRNVTVAIIDSGIDYNHSALGGCFGTGCRVKGGYDFVNNDSDPMDDFWHGTHVAGIVGAQSVNGTVSGVAPGVDFLALKACDAVGNCELSNIIAAIEYAVNNSADIISMSLGGSYSDVAVGNTGKDSTSLAADAAVNSGKIVIIAAGNHGPGISTIAVPGAAENVITVGNIDDGGTLTQSDDTIASSSSRGPVAFGRLDPDVVAPGTNIYSTYLNNTYATQSGTSMATPHVSGVAALMLEQNRTLTPAQVRRIIMQTAVNVSGRVFDTGAGEINAKNALLYNVSATVDAENSYGASVSNDRWEFIAPPNGTVYANITVANNNDHSINFTLYLTEFQTMENSNILDTTQFSLPSNVVVPAGSTYTIEANFTTENFQDLFASTYGGKLMLIGNGTGNGSKNISIPIVVTIPIKNHADLERTLVNSGSVTDPAPGDVVYYAYYNLKAGNETITVSWADSSSDLDLYVYNSTADLDDYGGYSDTSYESVTTLLPDSIKWFRVHGYDFSPSPFNFTINITDNGNIPSSITNVTNAQGTSDMNFTLYENTTLMFYFTNPDDDALTITFNDSRYTQESLYPANSTHTGNVTYTLENNVSLIGNHTVRITVEDEYGAISTRDVLVRIFDVNIDSYSPTNLTPLLRKNESITFTQESSDPQNSTLYYYWYINGALNSTQQNLTLNTTTLENDTYNVTFTVSNNVSNMSVTWDLIIDQYGPNITILNPNITANDSRFPIRLNLSDPAGVSACWYHLDNINGTLNASNVSIPGCNDLNVTSVLSGNYTLTIYSNDTYGFVSSSNKNFLVADATPPRILSMSPDGDLDYTDEVTLRVTLSESATCKYSDTDESYGAMTHTFTTTGTTNTRDYGVDEDTDYVFYIACMDINGVVNQDGNTINFSIGSKPVSSGGGGGSTGGSTSPPPSTSPSSSNSVYSYFVIDASDNITMNINSENISLKYALIRLLNPGHNIDMSIEQVPLDSLPSVSSYFTTDRRKYAFIDFAHDNLLNSDIDGVIMRFRVKKSWITSNSIDMSSIRLYRYTDSWHELPTTLYSQDSTDYTYESTSPGLSYFIIAGKEELQPPTVNPPVDNNPITGNDVLVRKNVTEEKPLQLVDDNQTDGSSGNPSLIYIIIGIGAAIAILGGADFLIIRKKKATAAAKENRISELKKEYEFEGNQMMQEYRTRLNMLANDPRRVEKAAFLKQQNDARIKQLHDKYMNMITDIKNS